MSLATLHRKVLLQPELIRAIFAQEEALPAKDRLRGKAVCRAWRAALADLPFQHFLVTASVAEREQQLLWMINMQPTVLGLSFIPHNEHHHLVALALHSLPRQALQMLSVGNRDADIQRLLPAPTVFPNLVELRLSESVDAAWLSQLARLRLLKKASLNIASDESVRFPAIPNLAELHVSVDTGSALHLPLGTLPALQQLWAHTSLGAGLVLDGTPAGAPRLASLALSGFSAQVQPTLFPALTSLSLSCSDLDDPVVFGSAPALRVLRLGNLYTNADIGWQLCLLESMPRSVRGLHLEGRVPAEVAATVAGLTRVRALAVGNIEEGEVDIPAGPLWEHLEALCWGDSTPLPLALRGAPRVHSVAARVDAASDLCTLRSLPSLRHLEVATTDCQDGEREEGAAEPDGLQLARVLLPGLQTIEAADVEAWGFFGWEFVRYNVLRL